MNLIECLLRIADTGLYPVVLEIFKHGIQRSGELIFLGLLQLHVRFTSLFRTEVPLQFLGSDRNREPVCVSYNSLQTCLKCQKADRVFESKNH